MNKGYEAVKDKLAEASRQRGIKNREKYYLDPKRCLECENPILYEKKNDNKFCNSTCSAKYNNRHKPRKYHCIICGKILSKGKYCSGKCQTVAQDIIVINNWMNGKISGNTNAKIEPQLLSAVRRWCLNKANNKCEQCGWSKINPTTGKIPLQIHHKDGNAENSIPGNLEVLCPNCHSLTPTFGGSNKGSGRKNRRMVKSNILQV
jgi:predicted nucleic acid-binding Zn ribbon protein